MDNVFTKMLRGAVSAGFIPQSPCRDIRLPRVEREEMRFLTPEEIRRLADAIGPRYRGLVLVMAYGGLRWGEAAGLRVPRLHLPPTASPLRSLWRTRFFHPAVEAAGLAPLRVHDLVTPRWRSGSHRAPTSGRSRAGPATRRSRASSTPMGTSSRPPATASKALDAMIEAVPQASDASVTHLSDRRTRPGRPPD